MNEAEMLGLAQKLRALTDENTYLERHLAVMMRNNQRLQSMSSKINNLNFQNDQIRTSKTERIAR